MRPLSIICLLLAVSGLHAQTAAKEQLTSGTSATTESIDLFKTDTGGVHKSLALAMAASLILPGAGHQYLGRNQSAFVYLSVEALSVFAFIFCDYYSGKIAQDAAGFAWVHANASGSIHSVDDTRWRLIGYYMDVQSYNNDMDLNRTPDQKITDPSQAWYWDDKSSQDQFNALRNTSRTYGIVSKFFIGAMVLNRITAFIDVRTTMRNKSINHSAGVYDLTPYVSASPNSLNLAIAGSF